MARTQFHKNQHVYVKSVSTWALIERPLPHWTTDTDEPIRIHYDVGLCREFAADESLNEELLNDRAPRTYPLVARKSGEDMPSELTHRAPHLPSDVKRIL